MFQDCADLEGVLSGLSSITASGVVTSTRKKIFKRVVVHLTSLPNRIAWALVLSDEGLSDTSDNCLRVILQPPEGEKANTDK